jgi:DNA-binding transcriptional LysR family regulator
MFLAPVVLEFLHRYLDMRVDLMAEGSLVDIVAGGFDAGIRFSEAVPQDMISVPLENEHSMAVVASPAYLSGHAMPGAPADLLKHDCVRTGHPSGVLYRWELSKRGREERVDVRGRLPVNNYNLAIDAALADAGFAYTSYYFIRDHIVSGRLIRVLEDWTPPFPVCTSTIRNIVTRRPGCRRLSSLFASAQGRLTEIVETGYVGQQPRVASKRRRNVRVLAKIAESVCCFFAVWGFLRGIAICRVAV